MDPLLAGGIVTTLIGGITSYLQSSAASKDAKAQAQQLKNNMLQLQQEIERGELEMNDALARIDEMVGRTKGEIKTVMEKQINLAVGQVKDQYRIGLDTAMKGIKEDLGRRRMFGSEAGQEIKSKTSAQATEQANKQVIASRERAANQIAAQMTQLNLRGGMMKEGRRTKQQQFRLGALGEIMQMQSMASSLESQADVSPWLSTLGGAAGGLSSIAKSFAAPGLKDKEEPSGSGISKQPGGFEVPDTPYSELKL